MDSILRMGVALYVRITHNHDYVELHSYHCLYVISLTVRNINPDTHVNEHFKKDIS